MDTPTRHLTVHAQDPLINPIIEQRNVSKTDVSRVKASGEASFKRNVEDPHGLRLSAPLAFAAWQVALEFNPKSTNCPIDKEAMLKRLRKRAPKSAFEIDFVARTVSKLINPRGHGANSARFNNDTLAWFRQTYPAEAHLTSGFSLLICAARWWIYEQGSRSVNPLARPLTTSDLDSKLSSFGFVLEERKSICRMLRRVTNKP